MLKSLVCLLTLAGALLATSLTANAQMDLGSKNRTYKHPTLIYKHDSKTDLGCKGAHANNLPWCQR